MTDHRGLLDLGAGDGTVTAQVAQFFSGTTYVTEPSIPMQYRLRQRGSLTHSPHLLTRLTHSLHSGYTVIDIDKWHAVVPSRGLITALNLLDRHPEPKRFLSELHAAAMQNSTRVLLAFVLPFSQFRCCTALTLTDRLKDGLTDADCTDCTD